jgi:hypothetical protein
MRTAMKLGKLPSSLTTIAGLALSATPVAASAQAQPAAGPSPAPGQAAAAGADQQGPKVKVERGAGGKTVYRITEAIRIEGKIQKPEAFYVLQKSSINYDWQDLKQDFVPKIVDSVSRAPF